MRWPIRIQIMLPMSLVMLVVVAGVSALNAYLSIQQTRLQIEQQLRDVSDTLADASFPLTGSVLRHMRGLSGAEFVLTGSSGQIVESSLETPLTEDPGLRFATDPTQQITLVEPTRVGQERYYYAVVPVRRRAPTGDRLLLHILFPEQTYSEALRQAVLPPLVVGGTAILLVIVLALAIASRVTRPLRELGRRVERISQGDFRSVPPPQREDEVQDLAKSVNEMAQQLTLYEDQIRRSEQLRTIGQIGAGIAHQLRNAATGCRMALDLHRGECGMADTSETLDVAFRQLALMERYLKRFLTRSDPPETAKSEVDLRDIVRDLLPLVRPAAQHLGVELDYRQPDEPFQAFANAHALEQVILNLLLNGIEAAAHQTPGGRVMVHLRSEGDRAVVEVFDDGPGPADHVQNRIFEPLVTEKVSGTGLGLSVAKELIEQNNGTINWRRRDGMTCFSVSLPLHSLEAARVEAIGH